MVMLKLWKERLLGKHAAQPLSEIWELVMREVKQYGVQQDDQSFMLLRVRPSHWY